MSAKKDLLDLDALAPEPKYVILDGKEYKVLPPRFRQLIMIQRLFVDIGNKDPEVQSSIMTQAEEVICTIIPEMKDNKEIDFSFQQLMVLLSFIMTMADTGDAKKTTKTESKKK